MYVLAVPIALMVVGLGSPISADAPPSTAGWPAGLRTRDPRVRPARGSVRRGSPRDRHRRVGRDRRRRAGLRHVAFAGKVGGHLFARARPRRRADHHLLVGLGGPQGRRRDGRAGLRRDWPGHPWSVVPHPTACSRARTSIRSRSCSTWAWSTSSGSPRCRPEWPLGRTALATSRMCAPPTRRAVPRVHDRPPTRAPSVSPASSRPPPSWRRSWSERLRRRRAGPRGRSSREALPTPGSETSAWHLLTGPRVVRRPVGRLALWWRSSSPRWYDHGRSRGRLRRGPPRPADRVRSNGPAVRPPSRRWGRRAARTCSCTSTAPRPGVLGPSPTPTATARRPAPPMTPTTRRSPSSSA